MILAAFRTFTFLRACLNFTSKSHTYMQSLKQRYLKLLKLSLTDIHRQQNGEYKPILENLDVENLELPIYIKDLLEDMSKMGRVRGYVLCKKTINNEKVRQSGLDWPTYAETMIGIKRLNNIQFCAKQIFKDNIPGDFIETGVWRGGASIFMRALLEVFQVENKRVWVADSFRGLPKPNAEKYPEDKTDSLYMNKYLQVSMAEVKNNFKKYDLLDDRVKFLKGWFKDTLPTLKEETFSLVRLDGDMYESTINALDNLYPRLSVGGYLIVDDFALDNCRAAVEDYRKKHHITDEMIKVDWSGVYWKKS